jgi:hypothetical protein
MGKPIETREIYQYVREMICDNPNFPESDQAIDIIASFFESVKYGNADLKGINIMAHTRSLNAWLANRTAYRPTDQPTTTGASAPKPEHWRYDPNEPLPSEITPQRALDLLNQLARWRGTSLDQWRHKTFEALPIGSVEGWTHYINKLKARAKQLA